ncbi:hypothetical protein V6N13_110069 [Hibiscus sabdariffa]|uniref:Uncharacterized protein n=1 Tax=Hibiscus sabdariffa TaxID=183260 RepID=A0ABR2BTT7_9ROSI
MENPLFSSSSSSSAAHIENEPKALFDREMKLAREAALEVINNNSEEQALKIFLQGIFSLSCRMESENGITMEEEIIVSEKAYVEKSAAEEKKLEPTTGINGEGASNLKEDSKQHGTKSEGKASKAPANVYKSQISKTFKEPDNLSGGNAKKIKVTKDKPNMRTAIPITRNQRPVLSQSHSFLARRVHGDAIVKSIDF